MTSQKLFKPFLWAVAAAGAAALFSSVISLPVETFDARLAVLCALTLCITSHISIPIPGVKAEISVSDTFVFLTLLLYGAETAVVVAAAESALNALHTSKTRLTWAFNIGSMAVSTYVTAWALGLAFGRVPDPHGDFGADYVAAVCLMAVVQYVCNSGTVAVAGALRTGQPVLRTWYKHYLWTSITYVAGASAAGIIGRLIIAAGDYAIVAATPIIVIVYFTYRTYLKNVESSAAQAEQAERHVEELSHYIAEQERIREQFTQIEKLSALGELASGVAHDFNNTLAGILGRAQLMLRTDDPEKIRRGLHIIIKTAEDGAKTVKRIQDFARQRRDHDFQPTCVDQLLADVGEITRPRWKDRAEAGGVRIELSLRNNSRAFVMGDDSELREVLVNMVFNAVDAMPEGGTLTLAASERDGAVELVVGDTGTGMSADVRSRIFDPFFTTKGKAGLGLGLAVSYSIIRRHEGTIEVDSEPRRGTTFRIKLPTLAAEEARPETVEPVAPILAAPPAPRARILVVDDEACVRELLHDILESEGYEVVSAAGGHEALACFDAGGVDGVFTDIGMPGMSGWELARAIRERDLQVPLAVITGWGDAVGSDEQSAAGVNWVVTKPFSADRVAELASEIALLAHSAPAAAEAEAGRLAFIAA
ncbi:MAG TPA: ATP-binding protein [Pyrinomonadaceae bacterium]|nr:ATP-binding protein [Pyrinomonadaceae bacterium]